MGEQGERPVDSMKPAACSKLSLRFLSGPQIVNSRAKLTEVIALCDGTNGHSTSHINKLKPTHYLVDCKGKSSVTPNKTYITGFYNNMTLAATSNRCSSRLLHGHSLVRFRH